MEVEEKEPLPVRIKYYTTLTLGLVACLSCFIFMFMVPFVLDPSISTLVANFDPVPVVCKTVLTEAWNGSTPCKKASCRTGCTTDIYSCERIFVDYARKSYQEYMEGNYEDEGEITWTVEEVPVYVNIKACGYKLANVNCTQFSIDYSSIGSIFPCYYSRADPKLVITNYSWDSAVNSMILALIIPNTLTGVSLAILSYWWYPGCQKRRCQYQLPPDQEAATGNQGEEKGENDDDDDESEDEKKIIRDRISEEEEEEEEEVEIKQQDLKIQTKIEIPDEKV